MPGTSDDLTKDEVLDLLSNARRRYLIHYLVRHGGRENLSELAGRMAAWEMNVPPDAITDDARRRVYISLYQTHLPKLEQSGIITYDQDARIVELTDRADELVEFLPAPSSAHPWYAYYLFVGAAGTAVLAAGWIEVVAFPVAPVGILLGLVVIVLAIIQFVTERREAHLTVLESLVE